mmetsp:Transcript_16326/g.63699  ORF Transcript_16326/g.63699 Transcript_16326/m.63699 type:complete len:340 (-) Transcript_16326:610-1629(-)
MNLAASSLMPCGSLSMFSFSLVMSALKRMRNCLAFASSVKRPRFSPRERHVLRCRLPSSSAAPARSCSAHDSTSMPWLTSCAVGSQGTGRCTASGAGSRSSGSSLRTCRIVLFRPLASLSSRCGTTECSAATNARARQSPLFICSASSGVGPAGAFLPAFFGREGAGGWAGSGPVARSESKRLFQSSATAWLLASSTATEAASVSGEMKAHTGAKSSSNLPATTSRTSLLSAPSSCLSSPRTSAWRSSAERAMGRRLAAVSLALESFLSALASLAFFLAFFFLLFFAVAPSWPPASIVAAADRRILRSFLESPGSASMSTAPSRPSSPMASRTAATCSS